MILNNFLKFNMFNIFYIFDILIKFYTSIFLYKENSFFFHIYFSILSFKYFLNKNNYFINIIF